MSHYCLSSIFIGKEKVTYLNSTGQVLTMDFEKLTNSKEISNLFP